MEDIESARNAMLKCALKYADLEWAVLPLHSIVHGQCTCGNKDCSSPGKHPRTLHGVKDASSDPDVIMDWFTRYPDSNIGIATGSKSGIFVIDIDGVDGERSLETLQQEYGPLPTTLTVRTGSGGRHLYFLQPPNVTIKNKVALLPGVDIRGDDGFVVAPPSIHASGSVYKWESEEDTPIANPPDWLLKIINEDTLYFKKAEPRMLRTVDLVLAGVPEGQRNNTLFKYACRLKAKRLTKEEATALVLEAASKCIPPLPEKETLKIIESAWKYSESYSLTDLGNADRLVALHGQDIRYCKAWKEWLIWDGRRWKIDDTFEIMRKAEDVIQFMKAESSNIKDPNERERFERFITQSEQKEKFKAMIDLAVGKEGIAIQLQELDTDPWLLNVTNGTIDLRTGYLRPHKQEDLITKIADVEYDANATAPRWEQFLYEIMLGDENLVKFLQRAVGMSLTGVIEEHALFVLYGTGRNGKSTFLNTLIEVLGDYAMQSASDLLMALRGDTHPTMEADLFGKRFVVTAETGQGQKLNEALVKLLTGGDKVRARRMRENYWEFKPTHHIWLATNYKPRVYGTDIAMWSRIKLIPFNAQFLDGDPRQDKKLPEKLLSEKAGILRWAVEGCLLWQKEGLGVPEKVIAATNEYKVEQDTIAAFISDCIETDPNSDVTSSKLYKAYTRWCEENGERPFSQRELGVRLTERGFTRGRATGGVRVWKGIKLTTQTQGDLY